MPIYEQTYRRWETPRLRGGRWLAVAAQELRVARTSALYRRLLLLSCVPFLLCLFLLLVTDLMTANPSMLLRSLVRQVQFTNIDARFFRMYISMATPFAFIFCLLVGGGSICNDHRHNLLEVYFAKPLGKGEYFFGKLAGVCYVPLCVTAAPALGLYLLHMIFSPGTALEFVRDSYWVPGACVALSVAVVVPTALFIMACSAVSRSTGFASVIACALLFMNSAFGNVLAEVLRVQNLRCLSYTRSLVYLGDLLFGDRTRITLHWGFIIAGFAVLSLLCAGVVLRRIRNVEIGS
ncbi:MAG: ABC transporter permease subunit [Candidatus Hydrogenedentes bacterium]|nr:ABC transporter permease subunit [Candidatus Hydrogenedentota bacterium]